MGEMISPLYVCNLHFVGDKTNCEQILILRKVSQFSRLVIDVTVSTSMGTKNPFTSMLTLIGGARL